MTQPTVAQDVASIIAQQVTEQLEEVESTGIMTVSDRKAVEGFLCSKFAFEEEEGIPDYYRKEEVHYSMNGDRIEVKRDYSTSYNPTYNTDADFFVLKFMTHKTTRRVKRQPVIKYECQIRLYVIPKEGKKLTDALFSARYSGSEKISREATVEMFEKVLGVIRKTNKCSVCKAYKRDVVCCKDGVGICSECHMHARVKRARTGGREAQVSSEV